MSISSYLELKILDFVLRNTDYAHVATVYLSLHTESPGEGGGGEVSGGSYARQAITWSAAADGQIVNSALITFPTATAPWGTVTHMGIYDALAAGNLLWYGAVTVSKLITTGDTAKVQTGALVVTLE